MSAPPTIPANLLQKRSIENRQVLYFNNREAYLAGIYPGIANLDGVNGDTSSIDADTVDYRPNMESLAKYGNNFFRHWVIFYPNFIDDAKLNSQTCEERSESVTSAGVSWRSRYSPFSYTNQKKWILAQYNEDFFKRLRLMIETAREYGLVVQLTIFDRCGLDFVGSDKCKRWPYSPWNSKRNTNGLIQTQGTNGVNEFYERSIGAGGTTLGALQDAYVSKLVTSTMEYPNVVYEIMNEPIHKEPPGTTDEQRQQNTARRVKWADAIVGAIDKHTQGKRFIFYNDHTSLSSWPGRGQDIIHWAQPNNGTRNFAKLDGVIFHGNVKAVNPGQLNLTLRKNLIIQVSTDTFGGQGKEYHQLTTANAFTNHMMFQAEAIPVEMPDEQNAAAGIGSAVPAPTLFKLPPFVATWIKTGETPPATGVPHVCYTQNADASMVVMNPDTDRLSQQGRVVQLYTNKIGFWNEALQRVGVQEFTLTDNSQTLTLKRADGGTQTFKKYAGPLQPFLYQWERISDTAPAPPAPFFVFFYPDGALRTRNISDFAVTNNAHVTFDTPQPNQIRIKSDTFHTDVVWNYSFAADGRQLTLERVTTDPAQAIKRVFRRVI